MVSDSFELFKDHEGLDRGSDDQTEANNASLEFTAQNNFFADSPYFDVFVDKEMKSIGVVVRKLREINSKMPEFHKAANQMAVATRQLSISCRFNNAGEKQRVISRNAFGNRATALLDRFGKALEEIAAAQESFNESIQSVLDTESLCDELNEVYHLAELSSAENEKAEQMMYNYISKKDDQSVNSKEGGKNDSNDGSLMNSFGFGNFFNSSITTAPSHVDTIAEINANKLIENAKYKLELEEIRKQLVIAELNRLELSKYFLTARYQRNELLHETTSKFLAEIDSYFTHSAKVVEDLIPCIEQQGIECSEIRKSLSNREGWDKKEQMTLNKLAVVDHAVHQATNNLENVSNKVDVGEDTSTIDTKILEQHVAEEQVGIWKLPQELALSSRFCRIVHPDIIVEGKLFQKNTSIMASLKPWNKQWVILNSGILSRVETVLPKKRHAFSALKNEKIKICDIVLCSIRELPDDKTSGARFLFQLNITNQKPIIFMARGPLEYNAWVEGIRSASASEIADGNTNCRQLNKGIGFGRACSTAGNMRRSGSDILKSVGMAKQTESRKGRRKKTIKQSPLFQQIKKSNPLCADCNNPSPDWASLNLGIVLCIECSGAHRSLGVHISKVRSLTYDSLSDREARLILSLGNTRVNQIWERNLMSDGSSFSVIEKKKLNSNSDQSSREEYIRRKYVKKDFMFKHKNNEKIELEKKDEGSDDSCDNVNNEDTTSLNSKVDDDDIATTTSLNNEIDDNDVATRIIRYNKDLYDASQRGDIVQIATAIAFGADVNWKNNNVDDNSLQTALHAALTALLQIQRQKQKQTQLENVDEDNKEEDHMNCVNFLLQNGADANVVLDSSELNEILQPLIE